ncbi:putative surface protein with fasciclin (FAS1) repeats [Mucilaginibacter frigoritolerans]|uniref:Putative surface protein with fasciclin (FAS1) repeats n=1 Tax=Mucilaginibacter frigoritolerans TaxID=652788 RepID=A0A562TRV0_9SPHI|nr:fasciclin domain-containing protein [Mucilaginibacter frigoritolerans]TWI96331.1 putative surface protein with fasciclin (FAS1) repeats [Mucilaginibacter frigoritolerans]
MKKTVLIVAAAMSIGLLSNNLFAQTATKDTVKKTTATTSTTTAQDSTKDIFATLANVAEETTLVNAIKTAGLDADLKGAGPFTLLAPGNDAFSALPAGKLDSLLKNQAKLVIFLKAHIISGKYDKAALIKELVAGKGKATLKTIDGQELTLSVKDKKLAITDSQGTTVEVTSFDTPCSNGIIDGVNGVLMTK